MGVNSVWAVKKTSGFLFAPCLFETDSSGVTKMDINGQSCQWIPSVVDSHQNRQLTLP